jgi:hypothetical protein
VRPLVHALERHGWTVWWDRTSIPVGQTFDQVIETALDAARCVIVVWSNASVQSDWVKAEAEDSRQRGILIPVAIETELRLPLSFRFIQTAQLADWQGDESHDEFRKVVMAMTALIGAPSSGEAGVESVPLSDELQAATPLPGDELSNSGLSEADAFPPTDEAVEEQAAPPDRAQPDEPPPDDELSDSEAPETESKQPPEEPPVRVKPPPEYSPSKGQTPWLESRRRFLVWGGVLVVLIVAGLVARIVLDSEIRFSPGSLGMEFVHIPAGTFQMGSTNGNGDEKPCL